MARIFPVNIKPTLMLLPGLLPLLSPHMPPSEVGAELGILSRKPSKGEDSTIYAGSTLAFPGAAWGTTLHIPEVKGS